MKKILPDFIVNEQQKLMSTLTRVLQFQTTLCLSPSSCHSLFLNDIHLQLETQWKGYCTPIFGYLCEIPILSVHLVDQECMENGMWKVNIEFSAICLIPSPGMQVLATIRQVTSFGIFLNYESFLRCIIPNYYLEPSFLFRHFFSSSCFQCVEANERNGMTLQVGDICQIEITDVCFQNEQFSCIAKFISKE